MTKIHSYWKYFWVIGNGSKNVIPDWMQTPNKSKLVPSLCTHMLHWQLEQFRLDFLYPSRYCSFCLNLQYLVASITSVFYFSFIGSNLHVNFEKFWADTWISNTGCPKKTEDFDFLLERPFLAQIYHPIPFYDGKLRDFLIFMCSSTWFSLKYWRKWDLKSEVFFHNFPHFAQMITVAFWLSSKDGTITLVVVPQISKTFFLRIAESLSFPKIPIVTSLGHYE